MEENKLELNEKFFSFDGVIGRYGYLFNLVIICTISFIVTLPYTFYISTHAQSIMDYFGGANVFVAMPLLLQFITLVGLIGVCTLSISNMYRRLKDLFACDGLNVNMLILLSLSALGSFSFFLMPIWANILFLLYGSILGLILLFKKGKVTSTLPYDFKKEFNWGAFFGTWIWGLFNKSYVPLWHLLLWMTPLGFYFRMICGLKGNKWAYEHKKCDDVAKFNKSQETQALVFIILHFILWPILIVGFIVLIIVLFALIGAGLDSNVTSDSIKEPAGIEQVKTEEAGESKSFLDNMMAGLVSVYFERYEITEDENKFYVAPYDWESADFKDKKDMLDIAATTAAEQRRKNYKPKDKNDYEYFSKTSELPRTKIYSVETNQLLGEFNMDESAMSQEGGSFLKMIKAAMNAYRFYNIEKK